MKRPSTRNQRRPGSTHSPAANSLWIQRGGVWTKIINARVERDGNDLIVTAYPDPGDVPPHFYFEEAR